MINEQINLALTELMKMYLGYADLSSLCSFKNHSNDRVYRYEYSFDDAFASNDKKLKNRISSLISNHAMQNDCVVYHQHNSIRVEKKIYSR
ncbi:MAG: hypothetical protein WCF67_13245 [Chitinophagaceae bacterium]